jgi:hypothetical protein
MSFKIAFLITIILISNSVISCYALEDTNEIEFFIKEVNDANYNSFIYMNFKIYDFEIKEKKIICQINNGYKRGDSYVKDYEYTFLIEQNPDIPTLYNKSVEKKIKFYGENIYYPFDEYLLNITYIFNATLFKDLENPFDKRTWPGDWTSQNYELDKKYQNNYTIINYQLKLIRASSGKTLYSYFYPSFYLIIGLISLLDIKNDKGKYRMYITLFLSIVSTLIFFFPRMPAKSGLNLVIVTTMVSTYSIILLFANDLFIDKFIEWDKNKYFNSLLWTSILMIVFHYPHLIGLLKYPWMNWHYFIRYIITDLFSFYIFPIIYKILSLTTGEN